MSPATSARRTATGTRPAIGTTTTGSVSPAPSMPERAGLRTRLPCREGFRSAHDDATVNLRRQCAACLGSLRTTGGTQVMRLQAADRKPDVAHWSRFWWCLLPDGSQSETDLFFVFDAEGYRFALHIENKPPSGSLSLEQARGYRLRATFKANTPRWLSHVDFETILLAPMVFIEAN